MARPEARRHGEKQARNSPWFCVSAVAWLHAGRSAAEEPGD